MKDRARKFFLLAIIAFPMYILARQGETDSLGVIQGISGGFCLVTLAAAFWFSKRALH